MTGSLCPRCPDGTFGLGGPGSPLVIPSILAPVMASLLVANRVYWRLRMIGSLDYDDVFILLATVSIRS
jgi:hypothetical protein